MASRDGTPGPWRGPARAAVGHLSPLQRFLRSSHLFSAAIREVIDEGSRESTVDRLLTTAQLQLLAVLDRAGPRTVSEVADILGVTSAGATRIVDRLEALSLVERSPAPADRRSTMISVTRTGSGLARACAREKRRRGEDALARLGDEEIAALSDTLERLSLSLFKRQIPRPGFCLRCDGHARRRCPLADPCGGCLFEGVE